MKKFMDENFLLDTETARILYREYADWKKVPVVDYHCHISPKEIYENKKFENIAQVWLSGDHYKWRQMRANGVDEYFITGDASDREKFDKWAETMPFLIGNPLYHWSHMELRYYFGFEGNLNPRTADEVWKLCSDKLQGEGYRPRDLIKKSNVKVVCTTDDPIDDLYYHEKLQEDTTFSCQVLPAFRPDRAINLDKPDFRAYITELSRVSQEPVCDFDGWKKAMIRRMDYFAMHGCRISDHGLFYVMYKPMDEMQASVILKKALAGEKITEAEKLGFQTACLLFLGEEYAKRGWVMQLHYGCKRDNNTSMYEKIGADTGFDCISNYTPTNQLADFLNALNSKGALPKTILYSLNPMDDAAIGTIIGCFQGGGKGKIQQGSAWWFNDHFTGMTNQMKSLASQSVFGNFIGMLTDSRSFLSYTRHDYFRRILCRLIGEWVENGEYPFEEEVLGQIITGISYNNAVSYFGFEI